jgi:hypothetical protein
MSLVKANTYQDASGGSNAVLYGVAAPTGSMGFRNRIINGDMRIDQRNAGASVSADNSFPVDRFKVSISGSATATAQRSTTVPSASGFTNSLIYTVGTGAAQGTSGVYRIFQVIEGFNTADLGWGASGASSVTLSFWVRSSVTGTFAGGLNESNGGTASYVFNYTISAANTWEYKTVTVAGPTIGTWQTGNSGSINVIFDLGSGTNFEQSAGSWTSSSNRFRSSGAAVLSATSGATFYITGVQLEAGSVASPFERRDYGRELIMCLRYYWRINTTGSAGQPIASGNAENSTRGYINLTLPQPMRTSPTCSISSLTHLGLRGGGSNVTCTAGSFVPAVSAAMATIIGGEFDVASSTSAGTGGCVKMVWLGASGWIDASAEL